jgi:hypothetical protein
MMHGQRNIKQKYNLHTANKKRVIIKRGCKLFTLILSINFSLCGYKKTSNLFRLPSGISLATWSLFERQFLPTQEFPLCLHKAEITFLKSLLTDYSAPVVA